MAILNSNHIILLILDPQKKNLFCVKSQPIKSKVALTYLNSLFYFLTIALPQSTLFSLSLECSITISHPLLSTKKPSPQLSNKCSYHKIKYPPASFLLLFLCLLWWSCDDLARREVVCAGFSCNQRWMEGDNMAWQRVVRHSISSVSKGAAHLFFFSKKKKAKRIAQFTSFRLVQTV